MSDKDLSDDMLKLVRYKILFVKRDYEYAFPEREELVYDNMTGDAFCAWKVAEFIQRLNDERVPRKWRGKSYPRDYTDPQKNAKDEDDPNWPRIERFDESDKKFLRVYYEVLERYEREDLHYEEDQLRVLREIRDRL